MYPVSLTGLGERAHLADRQVNLDTHITDVTNLIAFEDLRLVGPQWRHIELPTGHWPMFSRPDDVARILDDLAK